jgi:hypothetical protein
MPSGNPGLAIILLTIEDVENVSRSDSKKKIGGKKKSATKKCGKC